MLANTRSSRMLRRPPHSWPPIHVGLCAIMSSTLPGQFWLLGPRMQTACHSFIPSFVYSTKMHEHLLCPRTQHSLEEPRTPCSCPPFCTACIIIFNEMCQTCLTVHLPDRLYMCRVFCPLSLLLPYPQCLQYCLAHGWCSKIFSE